jgi:two-component system sensor kinase FixL
VPKFLPEWGHPLRRLDPPAQPKTLNLPDCTTSIDGWMVMEKARKKRARSPKYPKELTQRPEEPVHTSPLEISKMAVSDIQALVHDLQLHQIELEQQNEKQRRALIELAESRDRYSNLYESAPVGYVILDQEGYIIESNLTLAARLGLVHEKLAGRLIFDFADDASVGKCRSHLQSVFSSDTKQVCQLQLKKKGGGLLPVQLASIIQAPLTTETPRCRTAVIDITDLFKARQQLQQMNEELEQEVRARTSQLQRSESEFRALADNVPAMFSYLDRDQRYRYANLRYEAFWKQPVSTIVGKTVAEHVGPETYAVARPYLEKVLRGEPVTYEVDCYPPDGRHTMLVRCIPDRGDDGQVQGFLALLVDITEFKRAQEALREREQQLRAILNTAADAIVTIDRSGIIVSANAATERMFGYAFKELAGQNIKLLMPSPYREEHDGYLNRYLKTREAHIIGIGREVTGLRKDGSTFPLDLAVSEVEDFGLFTGIMRDISARKEAERNLEEYRRDLSKMSSELMLTEERERQRLAQDLHDGLGQALFRARMKLDQIIKVGDHAFKDVGTILEEIGKLVNTITFELSPLMLRQLGLRAAIEKLVRDVSRDYGLTVAIEDDGQDVPMDERVAMVLYRAVRELLINVAKHAETDCALVSIRRLDGKLQITVEDEGKGFNPSSETHLVGSGRFGLFSLRERLGYLNGTIQIHSGPGDGTSVTLTVPLQVEAQA